ncbi:MAG: hypothetical protein ACI9C1_003117 [Candidatus Aldehydirespiratoraceae bacterium]|jgi:hypothetical protein
MRNAKVRILAAVGALTSVIFFWKRRGPSSTSDSDDQI